METVLDVDTTNFLSQYHASKATGECYLNVYFTNKFDIKVDSSVLPRLTFKRIQSKNWTVMSVRFEKLTRLIAIFEPFTIKDNVQNACAVISVRFYFRRKKTIYQNFIMLQNVLVCKKSFEMQSKILKLQSLFWKIVISRKCYLLSCFSLFQV